MKGTPAWPIAAARLAGRLLFELMLWLPAWLILMLLYEPDMKLKSLAAAVCCMFVGYLFAHMRPPWRLIAILVVMLGLVAGTTGIDPHYAWIGVWLAAVTWRGQYGNTGPPHYALAFLVATIGVLVASNVDKASQYRIYLIVIAIGWIIAYFVSLNRYFVNEAGLYSSIATRAVRKDSRKYALLFLAVALVLFGVTLSYALQWLKLPHVKMSLPPGGAPELPEPQETEPIEILPHEPYHPNPIWNKIAWIAGGLSILVLAWFALWLWRDRKWTWQAWKDALRKLFMRDRRDEKLPYVEEKRSLKKAKRKSRWGELFQRAPRGPDWKRLNNAQKVRRLYADAMEAGVTAGYAHQAHHTASEALEGLEQWREGQADAQPAKKAAYWSWFAGMRQSLLRLYEQARYSPHAVREQEVASLIERHPERDRMD
ncbi:hypothetical protein [Cohnella yongneupensis]|uniref:DUF4129 domain-containing protein n=1 Tax=Cohnella yongneupensis TaxID=425006 RepID=A0ABW0QYC4_9BACL